MFAAVEFFKGETSFKGKLYDYFSAPEIISQRVEVPGALPFFTVKIKQHKGKIPFSLAQDVMGRLCGCVIYKDTPPKDSPFREFCGRELEKYLLFNSALQYIENTKSDPICNHITLVDENAQLTEKIESLVFLSNTIRIFTKEKEKYSDVATGLLKKYGVSVIVSGDLSSAAKDSTIIISDKSQMIPLYFKGTVFTNERRKLPFAKVICGEGVTLPQKYKELLPEGFSEKVFAAALYEKCGVKELEKLTFERVLLT